MALHGNILGVTRSPGRLLGGTQGVTRNNFTKAGGNRSFINASIAGVSKLSSIPEGIAGYGAWVLPQTAGGMSSRVDVSGTISSANLAMGLAASAALTGSGAVSAGLALIVSMIAALSGSGALSPDLTGILVASAALGGSGSLAAAMTGLSNLVCAQTGSGTVSGDVTGPLSMSANITVEGATLTTSNVAAAVWDAVAEGVLSYADIQRILLAVAAGKTTIIDLGGGSATVTFRDTTDTADRVVAGMTGSERTTVTLDPTET